jgi:hypothetical protein
LNQEGVISYESPPDHPEMVKTLHLPSELTIQAFSQLQSEQLILIQYEKSERKIDGPALRRALEDLKKTHPGTSTLDRSNRETWKLNTPVATSSIPDINWGLTERGSTAVNIMIKAVASQLAPKTPENR